MCNCCEGTCTTQPWRSMRTQRLLSGWWRVSWWLGDWQRQGAHSSDLSIASGVTAARNCTVSVFHFLRTVNWKFRKHSSILKLKKGEMHIRRCHLMSSVVKYLKAALDQSANKYLWNACSELGTKVRAGAVKPNQSAPAFMELTFYQETQTISNKEHKDFKVYMYYIMYTCYTVCTYIPCA